MYICIGNCGHEIRTHEHIPTTPTKITLGTYSFLSVYVSIRMYVCMYVRTCTCAYKYKSKKLPPLPPPSNHKGERGGSWSCLFNMPCFITEIAGSASAMPTSLPLSPFRALKFQINICMVTPVKLNLLCAPGYPSPTVRFRSGFPSPSADCCGPGSWLRIRIYCK